MAVKIHFDAAGCPEDPTLVLSGRSGTKTGRINAKSIHIKESLNSPSEIVFDVYKYVDGKKDSLWAEIRNFKLVWCKEWDTWFQITVDISEETPLNAKKTVYCTQLGQAEMSQIMLYNMEINTEDDISRDDYIIPTTLYCPEHPEASLLHRILEKAPHYSLAHVDASVADIQRTFSFDGTSIYDALQKIAQEIGCLFVFPSDTDKSGHINRSIEVYDLESNCPDCGYRGAFSGTCPICGCKGIREGYGKDTTVFVTSDELAAGDIQFTTDTGSVKNCFKLEAGDDLMNAAIRSCNPNGSDYIWHITKDIKDDMPDELANRLDSYDRQYRHYQKEYVSHISSDAVGQYNRLVEKYRAYNPALEAVTTPIVGYPALMTAYYNTIDLSVYLQSALMPAPSMSGTDAKKQAALLTPDNLSPVAVTSLNSLSPATADNALLGMAKAVIDTGYQVKVNTSGLSGNVWTGSFSVTNYSDSEDTAVSPDVTVYITEDYTTYVKQKLEKSLAKENADDVSVSGLFKKDYASFCRELAKYSLNSLKGFLNACQSCLDILIEQGIADSETWHGSDENLYQTMYVPYYNKRSAIESEIKVRQDELNTVLGTFDADGSPLLPGMQTYILGIKNRIQEQLDFQKYLGEDLWLQFCAYRREDKFSNSSYVSDGLNNAELFENALEFLRTAENEIYKSAELQHSISTTLKNLLVIRRFQPLIQHFEVGNRIRVRVDDNIYKLRLMEYEIDYSDLSCISVGFSDVLKVADGISDLQDILFRAQSMATSYDSVQRQASQGFKGSNTVQDWVANGLDATNTMIVGGADHQTQTWDEHGMLFKRYDAVTESYYDTQLKIIDSTLAITTDNWKTVKAAVGRYFYLDPVTNKLKEAYGVNGEAVTGKMLLGENLGIYSDNNSLTFDRNGLVITNGLNTFTVNPNSSTLLSLSGNGRQLLYATQDGDLVFAGRLYATTGIFGSIVVNEEGTSGTFNNGFSAGSDFKITDGALNAFNDLVVKNITADNVRATNVLADYATNYALSTAVANLQSLLTDNLNALGTRLETIEDTYITAGKVKAEYMELKNWTSGGYIKLEKIPVNSLAATLTELPGEVKVGHLISSAINSNSVQASGAGFDSLNANSLSVGGTGVSKQSATIGGVTINYWGW